MIFPATCVWPDPSTFKAYYSCLLLKYLQMALVVSYKTSEGPKIMATCCYGRPSRLLFRIRGLRDGSLSQLAQPVHSHHDAGHVRKKR